MSQMNLVNQLQESAERDDVLTVLRKTKRLASKLGLRDIEDWLKGEQNGYAPDQSLPEYRFIRCTAAFKSNGYIPIGFGHLRDGIFDYPANSICPTVPFRDSISYMLSLIQSAEGQSGIYYPLEEKSELTRCLRRSLDPDLAFQVTLLLRLNTAHVLSIPELVKNKILDWACALEVAGVTGEGMSFSEREKHVAHSVTLNVYGNQIDQVSQTNNGIGDVNNAIQSNKQQ